MGISHLVQAGSQGQQRFTCSCLAHQSHQGDGWIQQQIKREALFPVSRLDAAQMGTIQPVQRLDDVAVALMPGKQAVAVVVVIHHHDAFIGLQMLTLGSCYC